MNGIIKPWACFVFVSFLKEIGKEGTQVMNPFVFVMNFICKHNSVNKYLSPFSSNIGRAPLEELWKI